MSTSPLHDSLAITTSDPDEVDEVDDSESCPSTLPGLGPGGAPESRTLA
jgi:hypothetical protein